MTTLDTNMLPPKSVLFARLAVFSLLAVASLAVIGYVFYSIFYTEMGPGHVLFNAISWQGDKGDAMRNALRGMSACVAALLAGFSFRFYSARATWAYHYLAHPMDDRRNNENALLHSVLVVLWLLIGLLMWAVI